MALTHLDYAFAVSPDARGVPKIDWKRYRSRPEKVVTSVVEGVVLENRYFRATILPSMGRLHSFVNRETDRELLYINPIAIPLGAKNDTGFWMTWGGIEHVMPRGEHGTSHALSWQWEIIEKGDSRVRIKMTSIEPLTGLHHELVYQARAGDADLSTLIRVTNPGDSTVQYSHWTTATLAPGGLGEVTAKTELIVPADAFVPDDREFNGWMEGLVGPTTTAPIRFVGAWKDIGDLMATPLSDGYYAVVCREIGEGFLRQFPLSTTPGFDIWGWGFPVSEKRQREFTRRFPSNGYIEFWNGTVHGFSDESLGSIKAGESVEWEEKIRGFVVSHNAGPVRKLIKEMLRD